MSSPTSIITAPPGKPPFNPVDTTNGPHSFSTTTLTDIQLIESDSTFTDGGLFPTSSAGGSGTISNSGSNTSLATSAALYLYTFLATLVLLLIVSAAIVIRAFILRRRHRRMIEEAIRNGTWVSPVPPDFNGPGRGRFKVDLSKKPKMWEAFIDDVASEEQAEYVNNTGRGHGSDSQLLIKSTWRGNGSRNEWSFMRPFAASYAPLPERPDASGSDANGEDSTSAASGRRRLRITVPPPRAMFSRIASALNHPLGTSTDVGDTQSVATNNTIPMNETHHEHHKHLAGSTSPTPMRVAVLIRMPTPPSAKPNPSTSSLPSLPVASFSLSTPLPTLSSTCTRAASNDEEAPLPHIELGITDVLPRMEESDENDDDGSSEEQDVTDEDMSERTRGSESFDVHRPR